MAKTKISEYDSTAANNTDIDSINIAEGCAPSGINNAIRELMAHLKDMNIGSTITMLNDTEEDTDGGRANKIIFKGEQSGGEESVLAEIQASHDGTADDQKSDLIFRTNDGSDGASPTERMRIDSSGNVALGNGAYIGTLSSSHAITVQGGAGNPGGSIRFAGGNGDNDLRFSTNSAERMRIDSSGNLLVGVSSSSANMAGLELAANGQLYASTSSTSGHFLNNQSANGDILNFRANGSTVGSIGSATNTFKFTTSRSEMTFEVASASQFFGAGVGLGPSTSDDNELDLGRSNARYDDIFATNPNISTSDENEKQNIASLTSAEITAATAISKLFKTFKWKDKVAAKGDDARTHTGVVAQQVQTAMSDAGLDASNYAFWCSDTWWQKDVEVAAVEADEENGIEAKDAYTRIDSYNSEEEAPEGATKHTRLGVRYPELLAFIGAATEQRLTSIEARLDALEG